MEKDFKKYLRDEKTIYFYDYLATEEKNAKVLKNNNNEDFDASIFDEVISIYKESATKGLDRCYIDNNRLFIRANDDSITEAQVKEGKYSDFICDLYLRFSNNKIIIDPPSFMNNWEKNIDKLFEALKRIKEKCGINNIVLRTLNSKETAEWAQKKGLVDLYPTFINYQNSEYTEDIDAEFKELKKFHLEMQNKKVA